MLLFSAFLEVNESLTRDDFIRLAIECNQESPYVENVIPGVVWNGEHNVRFGDGSLWLAVEEYRKGNIMAIRFEKTEPDGAVWDTDYVMNFDEMRMSIQLERSYLESALRMDPMFSTPHFITLLIGNGCLKDDGALPVTNRPLYVDRDDLELLAGVINGASDFRLPVVYVSKTAYGEDPVDVTRLAGRLKGVAHVLVQKDGALNGRLRQLCGDRNEYNGAIGVYFPTRAMGNRRFLYRAYEGSDELLMEKVIRSVIQYSNSQMVGTLYTWSGVNNAILSERYSRQKAERMAAEKEREEASVLFDLSDEENRELREQVMRLTKANDALTYENQGLKAKLDSMDEVPALFFGNEEEFFPGEIREMILEAVNERLKNTEAGTRRHDVLSDIVERNGYEGIAEKRAERLKTLLNGYRTMSSTVRNELIAMGFTITEEGKHYRLTYYGDGRYKDTFAKTGSDHREGKNMAASLIRKML